MKPPLCAIDCPPSRSWPSGDGPRVRSGVERAGRLRQHHEHTMTRIAYPCLIAALLLPVPDLPGAEKMPEPSPHPSVGQQFVPADVDWEHSVYQTTFEDAGALRDWKLEGGTRAGIENGKLVLESEPPGPERKLTDNHLVCWLKKEMPADFLLEFTVRPRDRKQGLNIIFFNARGIGGESIFDPALKPRNGLFAQYHSGDLNNYHISYWAGDRGTANVRKNKGFALVATGPDLLVNAPPQSFQTIRLYKRGGVIRLMVDDVISVAFDDDGKTHGPVWTHPGWIGLRQMAHTIRCEYDSLRVLPCKP